MEWISEIGMKKSKVKYLKIYGIQRASTTYIIDLMRQNSSNSVVWINQIGHKHDIARDAKWVRNWFDEQLNKLDKDTPGYNETLNTIKDLFELGEKVHPLVVIKNPYSWYKSILRWATPTYKRPFDIEQWYNTYNNLYRNWKELLENPHEPFDSGRLVIYEEVLKNPVELLYYVRDNYGVELKDKITIPGKVRQSANFTEDRKRFYLQDGNFGLSNKLIKEITRLVDWELMKFYNYKPLEI